MQSKTSSLHILLLLIGVMSLIIGIGFRPSTVGSDTSGYLMHYQEILTNDLNYRVDYLFDLVAKICAFFHCSSKYFLTSFALINFIFLGLVAQNISSFLTRKITVNQFFLLFISFSCISPFFFLSQVNVMRQGTSILILLLFYLLLLNRRHWILILLTALMAQGFHHTAIIYIFFSPLIYFDYSLVMRGIIVTSVLYLSGLGKYLMSHFFIGIYDKVVNYGYVADYKVGIRYDFTIFTLGIGIIFHLLNKYALHDWEKKHFSSLLQIYWILALPFFLVGFGHYSDRYLLPAWVYSSVLAAVFTCFIFRRLNLALYWYYLIFFISSSWFILKTQGIIG